MRGISSFGAAVAAFFSAAALAHPQGAPWGSADPDTTHSCAACHFDHEPVARSQSLMLTGLPEYAQAGEAYEVTLRFEAGAAPHAGFMVSASTGAFDAVDELVSAHKADVRSASPAAPVNGVVRWSFIWRVGEAAPEIVTFRAAANAANDDASPFGDILHFRKFEIPMRARED